MVRQAGACPHTRHEVFDRKLCPGKGSTAEIAGVGERMARWRVCRSCDFWLTCIGYRQLGDQDPDGRRVLRVDGRHHMTWTQEQGRPPETGYTSRADRPYVLLEGETVRNARWLWLMGTIPDRFSEQLPDNARFLEPRQRRQGRFHAERARA
ncbi:hypothetical protein [Streptomyces griseomycini]|uniref:Uncharacterized protein n=1 Tax=Streptomyces griseomycini TaxID=66895 RepID=A0A7W7PWR8_9ACTN|nr:hypothetical protein [Streptomyces griseomycini]MBB4902651.1 hypothetical protein [Streptomyces griseomycini]GGQ35264.1 hypothetical protein GCM10010266_68440 [Streptomyces griseomycini]GGR63491.1 hypothetical protein GCM10015536_78320 [Streptomyces griseomycini]